MRGSMSRSRSDEIHDLDLDLDAGPAVRGTVGRGRRAGSTPPFVSDAVAPGSSPRGWVLSRTSSQSATMAVPVMSKVMARGSVSVSPERDRGGRMPRMRRGETEMGTSATGVLRGVRSRSVDRWGV